MRLRELAVVIVAAWAVALLGFFAGRYSVEPLPHHVAKTTSTAPENTRVTVVCYQSNGAELVRQWDFIGTGPYTSGGTMGDSPLRDSMNGKTFIIDGGCGLMNAVIEGP